MTNTVDELIESLIAATVNNEVKWSKGTTDLENVLEDVYGNTEKLYYFFDEEEGSNIVLATYKYYEGEVEADEFLKDGISLFVIDADDFEILNEVTDEDADDAKLFGTLLEAVEEA
jgi:selenocysteine lyase/cysteine desulfurase